MGSPGAPEVAKTSQDNWHQTKFQVRDPKFAVSPNESTNYGGTVSKAPVSHPNDGVTSFREDSAEKVVQNGPIAETDPDPWYAQTVLSLDGGGVKGYVSLLILEALMEEIERMEKTDPECQSSASPLPHRNRRPNDNTPSFIPAHYFDFVAGTSSGGILAIMLGRLRMSPEECLESYGELVDRVFGRPRFIHTLRFPIHPRCKFNHIWLEEAIKDVVTKFDPSRNADASLRQPCEKVCRTIVVARRKNSAASQIYLFRSYAHRVFRGRTFHEMNAGDVNEQHIWQVGRATSAAPFYFKAMKLKHNGELCEFFDGGLGANNPTSQACNTIRLFFNQANNVIGPVVSVGTGIVELEKSRFPVWGKQRELLEMIVDAATDSEIIHGNMANELSEKNYHRFNVSTGLGHMKLDAWIGKNGEETRRTMREATRKYLELPDILDSLKESARKLVAVRRARAHGSDPSRWEEFCHGVSYTCEFSECHAGRPSFTTAADFRSHLSNFHPYLTANPELLEHEFGVGKAYALYPSNP